MNNKTQKDKEKKKNNNNNCRERERGIEEKKKKICCIRRDKVIYEITKNVHAFALFGNWAGLFFVSILWFCMCSSSNMLKRNSSVVKVFFCCFFMVRSRKHRVLCGEFQLPFVPVFHLPLYKSLQFWPNYFHCSIYKKSSNRNHATIFHGISSPKNFFERIENFSNIFFFFNAFSLPIFILCVSKYVWCCVIYFLLIFSLFLVW